MRLEKVGSVTLNASGQGSMRFGPEVFGTVWNINRLSTNGNSTLDPTCTVYRGAESNTTMIDNTEKANADISETDLELRDGEFVTVVYDGGTPGAIMSFRIEGEMGGRYE